VSFEREQSFVVVTLCALAVVGVLLSVVPRLRTRAKARQSVGV
jgi:hypothetical protein